MLKPLMLSVTTVLIMLIAQTIALADIVVATSCSQTDVQASIDAASNGTIVSVPSGTCVWTTPVTNNKSITLQGAGIDSTFIIDDRSGGDNNIISVFTTADQLFRITGFTFSDTGKSYSTASGVINISGTSKTIRVDHNKFNHLSAVGIVYDGDEAGVIDHNIFNMTWSTIAIEAYHTTWDGYSFGDGSWASPLNLGGSRAIFIEDNSFSFMADGNTNHKHAWAVDSSEGGRYVFRYNTLNNVVVTDHGTDTGNNRRGVFSQEIYQNTFGRDIIGSYPNAILLRGGTGVIWGNTATGSWQNFANAKRYRRFYTTTSWSGACNGEGPYDLNDGVVYETGTHDGPDTGIDSPFVYSSVKSWPTNAWTGYSIINTTRNVSTYIRSNTTNTLTVYTTPSDQSTGYFYMNNGDNFKIMMPLACIDQVGRSTGDLLSGRPYPTPIGWPHQALEPVYIWNNTLNGSTAVMNTDDTGLKEGIDFINGTQRPSYTPFTYPHPLVTIKKPNAPTNLRML